MKGSAMKHPSLLPLNDGNDIPTIGFGTFDLGGNGQTTAAVTCALKAGYRSFDCARYYGNEREVGQALAQTDLLREDLFITTKVWNDRQLDGTVRQSIEESLYDLGLDVLDLLLVHWPVEGKFIDTWKVFEQAQSEHLVRSIGVSNFTAEHLDQLMAASNVPPAVNQVERSPYMQDDQTLDFCKKHGIVVEAWSPLGRGGCLDDPVITGIAADHEATAAQVVLAWHLQQGVVPLPRSKNPQRIAQNIQPLKKKLSKDEMRAISALNRNEPVVKGVDPLHFAPVLNHLSSHFETTT